MLNKKNIYVGCDITPKMRDLEKKLQINNGSTFLYILMAKQTICVYSLKFIKMIIYIYIYIERERERERERESCVNVCIYEYVIWPPKLKFLATP